jgi:hypothetical protein
LDFPRFPVCDYLTGGFGAPGADGAPGALGAAPGADGAPEAGASLGKSAPHFLHLTFSGGLNDPQLGHFVIMSSNDGGLKHIRNTSLF